MEKKQRRLCNKLSKLIFFAWLLINSFNLVAQNNNILNGSLKVKSLLDSKDSTLNLEYQCTSDFAMGRRF